MYINKSLYILLLSLGISISAGAQFNVKIGYTAAGAGLNVINEIHQEYNLANAGLLEQELKDIGVMHGLYLGTRYRVNGLGFELSWENIAYSSRAFGLTAEDTFFEDRVDYSLNSFSLGIENYFGRFGYGATVDFRRMAVSAEIPGIAEVKRKLVRQTRPASKFYFIYDVQRGRTVAFSVQPYVQIGWGSYEIQNIRPELIEGATATSTSVNPTVFGISFILINGRSN